MKVLHVQKDIIPVRASTTLKTHKYLSLISEKPTQALQITIWNGEIQEKWRIADARKKQKT
jgi:hypothetical protein